MKKLITTLAVICSSLAFSQSENNEFKVNILYTAIGMPELSYERLISDNSSVGASLAFSLDKKEDMDLRLSFTPYYRMFFGQKKAAGFFIEANSIVINYVDTIYFDGTSSKYETRTGFGLGAAAGAKFLTKNNLIGEVYGGVGRVFGDNSLGAYPRFGITLGKRF
ncbi:DUF3575 domain-containing protein [Cloacibacterium normanense]|uniref:DUF3575 domain-containing protein n=1 Tax=Cloacibacterium normanense TaxID=237258 RepID=UPI00352FEC80